MAKVNLQMDQNSELNTAILVTIQWKISLGEIFVNAILLHKITRKLQAKI